MGFPAAPVGVRGNEMDYCKIAKQWFEKGNIESDPFNQFICFWISFNALYNRSEGSSEKQRIEKFLKDHYREEIDSILEEDDVTFFYTPIKNLHPRGRSISDTSRYVEKLEKAKKPAKRIINLFLCIYQARCNLFHGDKVPREYRDQEIAAHSANILKNYLEAFLKCKTYF